MKKIIYCQTCNIWCTSVGNKIVEHSDKVGASPVSTAPTTSSFSIYHLASMDWAKTTLLEWETSKFDIWCGLFERFDSSYLRTKEGPS